jgi:hypothetical protein
MIRGVFTFFAGASLLLFIASCVLWVRSHWDGSVGAIYPFPHWFTTVVTAIAPFAWLMNRANSHDMNQGFPVKHESDRD